MALGLWGAGLGWSGAAGLGALLLAVSAGAAIYAGVLFGLWGACGRPAGAETDALGVIRKALRRHPFSRP